MTGNKITETGVTERVEEFDTKNFKFRITLAADGSGKSACFEIAALFKEKNSVSSITNLNYIISEFAGNLSEKTYGESTWEITLKRGKQLFKKAIEYFKSETFLKFLERALFEDLSEGDWSEERGW